MADDKYIREELVFQLTRGNAHMTFEEAVKGFPVSKINLKFENGQYTFWHLLEHIRRTQYDILDFVINSGYIHRDWPSDYWPSVDKKATKKDWDTTIKQFLADRASLVKLIKDPKTDLYKKIPWGSGQTLFREILVVEDHNAYHIGEFAIMKQAMGIWKKGPR